MFRFTKSLPQLPSSALTTLKWTLKQWKGHQLQAFLNLFLGLLAVGASLLFVWSSKLVVDIATGANNSYTLQQGITLLISFVFIEIILGIASLWIKATLGVKARNDMTKDFFSHLLSCQWMGLKPFHSGDLMNRVERDVSTLVSFLTEEIPSMITTVVQFIGAFLFLFFMNKPLAIVVAFLLPVFILASKMYMKKKRQITHEIRKNDSAIQASLQEAVQHRLLIKALNYKDEILGKLTQLQQIFSRNVIAQTKITTFTSTIMRLGFNFGFLLAFIWGLINLQEGIITYGSLMAFMQLVGQIQGPAQRMSTFIPNLIHLLTASERLMEIYKVEKEEKQLSMKQMEGNLGIKFERVSYAYEADSELIFKDATFTLPPHSRVAIVGETGVGKTTLIRLLFAFVYPQKGNIYLFNETEKQEITPTLRTNFAYVPQGNTLFSGTIKSNLLMGNPQATEEEIITALKLAKADFVLDLPLGINTLCGEKGEGFSEGQAQRLSIARALLQKGSVLILDEATSALDPDTETQIIQNLIQQPQTILCITHRMSMLKHCTHVLRLTKKGFHLTENL